MACPDKCVQLLPRYCTESNEDGLTEHSNTNICPQPFYGGGIKSYENLIAYMYNNTDKIHISHILDL